jgi:hypothetical protein
MTGLDESSGRHLIVLASQPRAGSTLLQCILGSHPEVHTTTEPWLMLEPCRGLQEDPVRDDYAAGGWAGLARDAFLKEAGGRDTLVRAVRAYGETVYNRALDGTGKSRFLDKTPRYYSILPALREVFPGAAIVVLVRNPLAVLCSIVRTWVQTHWDRMPAYRHDLLDAPRMLSSALASPTVGAIRVNYETLVADPRATVAALCERLGLPFADSMLTYNGDSAPLPFGDPAGVQRHDRAEPSHAGRWLDDLRDPGVWQLAADYLAALRESTPGLLGYDRNALEAQLAARRPAVWRRLGLPRLANVLATGNTAAAAAREQPA